MRAVSTLIENEREPREAALPHSGGARWRATDARGDTLLFSDVSELTAWLSSDRGCVISIESI